MMEEEFKIIENYQNYKVSNFGKVCNVRTGRILTPKIGSSCFLNVNLFNNGFGKSFTVHSLVAKTFIKNKCDYPCIIHIDDNKLNNQPINETAFCGKVKYFLFFFFDFLLGLIFI